MSQEVCWVSTSSICKIPQEILEIIVEYLDPKSALNLLQSSKTLLEKLEYSLTFWKHVCIGLGLETYEWTNAKGFKSVTEWRRMFHASQNIQNVLLSDNPLPVQRIVADLSKIGQPNINSKTHQQKILQLPQDANIKLTQNFKTLRRKLIADNIFSYGMSRKFFVLVVSNCQSYKSHFSVWNLQSSEVTYEYNIDGINSCPSLTNLWLASSEDILVVDSLLILMASEAKSSNFFNEASPLNSDLLTVFNLTSKAVISKYSLSDEFVRFFPLILKDGGGTKLLQWKGVLLAVCPEVPRNYYQHEHEAQPRIVLRFFDLSGIRFSENEEAIHQLEALAEYIIEDVAMKQPYSFMASDQKGPNIVLSFSKLHPDCISQQFVYISLDNKNDIVSSIRKYDRDSIERIPSLLCTEETARREQLLIGVSDKPGVFSLLDSGGLVTLVNPASVGTKQFYPVYGICDDFDTFYDELHIYQDKIVILKIFRNLELNLYSKNVILSVSDMNGKLLWKIKINPTLFNSDERLYLNPMFGKILISDAKKVVVYSMETGQSIKTINYYKYRRMSSEIERADPDTSPYAQTGISVWDLQRLSGHGSNVNVDNDEVGEMFVVVHDIERLNPIICDIYNLSKA